jgi:hypothetical protein
LLAQGDCYACECSRKSLRKHGVRSGHWDRSTPACVA